MVFGPNASCRTGLAWLGASSALVYRPAPNSSDSGCHHFPSSPGLSASAFAAPPVAVTPSLNFLADAASRSLNFLADAASRSLKFLADAASWLIDLTIGPPEEVLLRLDVELRPGVKLRLGRERFLCVLGTVLRWPLVAAVPPMGLSLIAMPGSSA